MRICGAFFAAREGIFMSKDEMKHTRLTVDERNKITLDGVDHIVSFDDGLVTLDIGCSRVSVEGEGLKIESLCPTDGEIIITGRVDGVFYTREKKAGGGLLKIFG